MSTDFFERQSKARKNTVWLIAMFLIALVCIVTATFLTIGLITGVVSGLNPERILAQSLWTPDSQSFQIGAGAGLAGAALILLGTLYKVVALRQGGGMGVAESVGGQRVYPNTGSLPEQRLLNVVEEMAIASGTPVPPVFILDEPVINAFAAGYSPSDAVIGVTRGAMEQLNREQLQGVIAHEFSHILNGDMRMNIRMIGVLHGILLLALIGKLVLRSVTYGGNRGRSRSNRGQGVIYLLALGVALWLLGSVGSLFGGLIKAAVSRQREYLADASAVQFTRNPLGIAGALKRIGAASRRGRLEHPNAAVASHMYFSQGIFEGFTGLMATHPPLEKRIRAIEPSWDGVFPSGSTTFDVGERRPTAASGFAGRQVDDALPATPSADQREREAPLQVVSDAVQQVGSPEQHHRDYAAQLIEELDPVIVRAVHEPYTARAVMFALLLDHDDSTRERQLKELSESNEAALIEATSQLAQQLDKLPDRALLPVVDLALPALAAMSARQYNVFMRSFNSLVEADANISLFEWTLAQVLRRHLRPHFEAVRSPVVLYYGLQRLTGELSVLLSTLARVGHGTADEIQRSFSAGGEHLSVEIALLPAEQCTLVGVDMALKTLARAAVRHRGAVVDACAATVCADGHVRIREAELLRGIADLLDCPMPPLI